MDATTVAVDLAKTVFELAIANGWIGNSARESSRRRPPPHVVMEACGMAHYWGRIVQQYGHRVTLVPPTYVRPYVRRNKIDRADAEAILEAVRSGEMPSVPVKRVEQQALIARPRAVDDHANCADQYAARGPAGARRVAAGRCAGGRAGGLPVGWD